tara:strand:+ start:524 stop:1378 length:855 start_codon:yes stop_codon:yes gene_type:complete
MQLRKIKVYGSLRKFLGKTYFEAAVNSPLQAFNFLKANYEGVEKHMNKQFYKVKMGGRVITQDFLNMKGQGEIQIIPVAVGAFDFIGDVFTAAFDFVVNYGLPVITTVLSGGTLTAGLVLGGLSLASDLLAPDQPSLGASAVGDTDPSIRGSYSFNNIQNTSSAGVPVPIIYGLVFSGSILISAGVDTARVFASIKNKGLYSKNSGSVEITITINNHPYITGQLLKLKFLTGGLLNSDLNKEPDNVVLIDSTATNTFIVISSGLFKIASGSGDVEISENLGFLE